MTKHECLWKHDHSEWYEWYKLIYAKNYNSENDMINKKVNAKKKKDNPESDMNEKKIYFVQK